MNTNNTRPMVNSTCLCKPDAYPISLTIAVVRNLTELNGSGKLTELPETRVIAMASPIARPTPSTIAEIMPDLAAGIITLKIVCIWEAPKARDEDFNCAGTAFRDDSLILMTVGRIMTANTKTAEIRFAPPVKVCVSRLQVLRSVQAF